MIGIHRDGGKLVLVEQITMSQRLHVIVKRLSMIARFGAGNLEALSRPMSLTQHHILARLSSP